MKRIPTVSVLMFALVLCGARAQTPRAEAARIMTIDEFLEKGLAASAGIVQADLVSGAAEYSYAQTRAARMFNLDANGGLSGALGLGSTASATTPLSASAGLSGSAGQVSFDSGIRQSILSPSSGATTTFSASGSVTFWDGFEGGKSAATLQKSGIAVDGRHIDSASARKTARYEIRTAWYKAVGYLRLLQVRQDAVRISGEQRKKMEAKFSTGNANKLEVQEAQAVELSAIIEEKQAAYDYSAAKQSLALLCGMDPKADFEVSAELPGTTVPDDLEALYTEGITNREDVAAFDLDLKTNSIDAALAKALLSPTVSGTSALEYSNNWTSGAASKGSVSLGVTVSMPVADSGSAAARGKELATDRRLIESKKSAAIASMRLDILQTARSMGLLAERRTLAERMLAIAKGKLVVSQARFDEGLGSAYDVLTAQSDVTGASVDLETAKTNLVLAWVKLEKIIGR